MYVSEYFSRMSPFEQTGSVRGTGKGGLWDRESLT